MANDLNLDFTLLEESQSGKVVTANAALQVLSRAAAGIHVVTATTGTVVLTATEAENGLIRATGTLTGNVTITFPAEHITGQRIVSNETAGAFTLSVEFDTGAAAQAITQGDAAIFIDGVLIQMGSGGGGGGGAPTNATYITQTADATLTNEQALSALSTGLVKVTTGTGVLSSAVAGDLPAHASRHQSGGSDAIKLDDLATPDDNTDLNASTSAHGLAPKLPGGTGTFFRADGSFATPPGTGAPTNATYITQTANGTLTNEQALSALATGLLKVTTGTGVLSAAAAGDLPAHASRHQDGGADEISVVGLSGLLADGQTPLAHKASHQDGGADEISVVGLSGLLADGQTPLAHASSHQSGGSDAIKLDDLATPDDNTDLNASTTKHGLLPKLGGGLSDYLRADGTWAAPGGGGGGGAPTNATYITQTADATLTNEQALSALATGLLKVTTGTGVLSAAAAGDLPAHASRHQDGGADEISVVGLSGLLADGQTPLAHKASHQDGGADEISVVGLSGLLADGQTPLAHASSHQSGGSDAIKLDDLATPDDNTDLNASTTKHGLLPKLGGEISDYLRADGTWAAPGGGGGGAAPTNATYITQTADATLTNEQALSALATGLLKVTTGTGVLSAAAASDLPAHASRHQSGGSDAIKLDDLATPDDNTDLNASTSAHGLLKKLTGTTKDMFRGDGTYGIITGPDLPVLGTDTGTATYSIMAAEHNKTFYNSVATEYTLPTGSTGFRLRFVVKSSGGIIIKNAASSGIRVGNRISINAGRIKSVEQNAAIELTCHTGDLWVATSIVGEWSVEIAPGVYDDANDDRSYRYDDNRPINLSTLWGMLRTGAGTLTAGRSFAYRLWFPSEIDFRYAILSKNNATTGGNMQASLWGASIVSSTTPKMAMGQRTVARGSRQNPWDLPIVLLAKSASLAEPGAAQNVKIDIGGAARVRLYAAYTYWMVISFDSAMAGTYQVSNMKWELEGDAEIQPNRVYSDTAFTYSSNFGTVGTTTFPTTPWAYGSQQVEPVIWLT